MYSLKFVIFMLGTICMETIFAQTNCELKYDAGKLRDTRTIRRYNAFTKCWRIKVPAEKYAKIEVIKLTLDRSPYTNVYLQVGEHTLKPPQSRKFETRLMKDENVIFHVENVRNPSQITASFELNYKVQSLACDQSDSFKCNATECVPQSQRCNGVKDCTNGADEKNCKDDGGNNGGDGEDNTGDENSEFKEAREKALRLLKSFERRNGGWGDNTPAALTAIHLAKGTSFNNNCEEQLVAKDLEFQIAVKSSPSPKDLAHYINALLAVCSKPRTFAGKDFVDMLKKVVNKEDDGLGYLALCNAKEVLGLDEIKKLLTDPTSTNENKYYGALILECMKRQGQEVKDAVDLVESVINDFKDLQMRDGSFSNDLTLTAMVVQVMKAYDYTNGDGSYRDAIKYLKAQMDTRPKDIAPLLFTLPVLGGKTLADIKCNNKKKEDRSGVNDGNKNTGLKDAKEKALKLLKSFEFRNGGWGDDTPVALTAIHLATGTNFNNNCEEKLVAKDLQFQIAVNESPSNKDLAHYINALLAVCSNPKTFPGSNDFVKTLKKEVFPKEPIQTIEIGENADEPVKDHDGLVYLALCNAKEKLITIIEKITDLLKGDTDEKKYYGALTLECMRRQNEKVDDAAAQVESVINDFKKHQMRDGSFSNNLPLTAMVVQVMNAYNATNGDGSYRDAIKYLTAQLDTRPKDIAPLLFTLPALGESTLADIKCNNRRKEELEFKTPNLMELILGYRTLEDKNGNYLVE